MPNRSEFTILPGTEGDRLSRFASHTDWTKHLLAGKDQFDRASDRASHQSNKPHMRPWSSLTAESTTSEGGHHMYMVWLHPEESGDSLLRPED
jgi:hypothetical protein